MVGELQKLFDMNLTGFLEDFLQPEKRHLSQVSHPRVSIDHICPRHHVEQYPKVSSKRKLVNQMRIGTKNVCQVIDED